MLGEEEYAGQDERARESARDTWHRALDKHEDVEALIKRFRVREMEAAVNDRFDTARWWLVVADTLSELRQQEIERERTRDSDQALLFAMEELGLVDGVWPDGYDQALDWNDGDFGVE